MSSNASLPKLDSNHSVTLKVPALSARSLQNLTPATSVGPSTPMGPLTPMSAKPPSHMEYSVAPSSTPFSSMSRPQSQVRAVANDDMELQELRQLPTSSRQSADATTQYSPPQTHDERLSRVEARAPTEYHHHIAAATTYAAACEQTKLEDHTLDETKLADHQENLAWLSVFETSEEDTNKNNDGRTQEAVDNWHKYVVMPSNISAHEEVRSRDVTPREHRQINLTVSEVPLDNASKNNEAEEVDLGEKSKITNEEPSPWVPVGLGSALVCVLLLL